MRTLAHRRQGASELVTAAEQAARSGAAAVALRGCTKRYGTGSVAVDALRAVDLHVSPGEFVVILGPSGWGKTTLLNVIGGIEDATEGSVVDVASIVRERSL